MKLAQALRITPGEVVALVGGGGKTTAMFQLANELAPTLRVLTTTSTRIFAAQIKRSPIHVSFNPAEQTLPDILPQLTSAIAQHGQVLLIGQADPVNGKAFGIRSEVIDALAASGHFDVILNEADGSRMRPFKAPATHEPAIPASTTLVVPVVGLDIVGQPLSDDTVHRANLVSQLSGQPLGQPISPATIAAVLCHPQGGLKNVPATARVVPLLNKLDGLRETETADSAYSLANLKTGMGEPIYRLVAQLLAQPVIDSVALGMVQHADWPVLEVHSRIAAVILAAGGSTRFGSPKQLARWGHKTFIEQAVDTALASWARPVLVVLGAEVEHSLAALGDRPVQVVMNPAWVEGQSTSVRAGMAALPANIGGAMFLLVDLPGLTPPTLNQLIERHRQTLAPLVWPEFAGQRGNPVLFDRSLLAELSQVSGDTGGKPVIIRYSHQAERVVVEDKGVISDIDRVEDLSQLA
jgi:molybdenum cofactor cytidylyltransferase